MRFRFTSGANALPLLCLLAAAVSAPACSLVIDSDSYVAPDDTPRDGGPDTGGSMDGSMDGSETDQGGTCGSDICAADEVCYANTVCGRLVTSCDPVTCTLGGCDSDTLGSDRKVCFPCDDDGDGFPSTLRQCSRVADLLPRDCDDNDPGQFPGAVPKCMDGVAQGCDSFLPNGLLASLNVAEMGRIPNREVATGLAGAAQVSTLALPGDYLRLAGDDPNAARWLFGFIREKEAQLAYLQLRGLNTATGAYEWNTPPITMVLDTVTTVPALQRGSTEMFVVASPSGQVVDMALAATSTADAPIVAHLRARDGNIATGAVLNRPADLISPLAIIHRNTAPHVVFRTVPPQRLESLDPGTGNITQTNGAPHVPSGPGFSFDTVGEHVFFGGLDTMGTRIAEAWDGAFGNAVQLLDGTSSIAISAPPRFSRDPENDSIIGLLPDTSGVRVAEWQCAPSAPLDECLREATAVQSHLPGLRVFDIAIFNGVLLVVHVDSDTEKRVLLDVFTTSSGTLTRLTPVSLPLMTAADMPITFSTFTDVQVDIQAGAQHFEIVIGVVADTTAPTDILMATGLRACRTL